MLEIPFLAELAQSSEAKGEVRGEARGESRGESRGEAKTWRKATRKSLRRRFGELAPNVLAALDSIADPAALEALQDFAETCPTLAAFVKELPPARCD